MYALNVLSIHTPHQIKTLHRLLRYYVRIKRLDTVLSIHTPHQININFLWCYLNSYILLIKVQNVLVVGTSISTRHLQSNMVKTSQTIRKQQQHNNKYTLTLETYPDLQSTLAIEEAHIQNLELVLTN